MIEPARMNHQTGLALNCSLPLTSESFAFQSFAWCLTTATCLASFAKASRSKARPANRTRANRWQETAAFQLDWALFEGHPSLTLNPPTYNARLSGAEVRSTEASLPAAGYTSGGECALRTSLTSRGL